MTLRTILLVLALSGTGFSLMGQTDLDFYYVDTTGVKPDCALPYLYFNKGGVHLDPTSQEDLRYIASILEGHPDMTLRLRSDGQYRRFDRGRKRLNRRRLKRIAKALEKKHSIPRDRLAIIPNEPWSYRSSEEAPPHQLVARRIICECIWVSPKKPKGRTNPENAKSMTADSSREKSGVSRQ